MRNKYRMCASKETVDRPTLETRTTTAVDGLNYVTKVDSANGVIKISLCHTTSLAQARELSSRLACAGGDDPVIGRLDDKIVVSLRPKSTTEGTDVPAARRKRSRHELHAAEDNNERISLAVKKLKLDDADTTRAMRTCAAALALRAARGEEVVEAFAVAKRQPGEWGAGSAEAAVVVSARLAAGVGTPLSALLRAFGSRGMIACDPPPRVDLPARGTGSAFFVSAAI